jgi:glycosyltransferase involved in cell wall biosynthesis
VDQSNRFRIGIIFNFTQGWLGGVYYYQNIIKALDYLEDSEKPELIIFYNKDYEDHLKEIQYPYLQLIPWKFVSVYKGYFFSFIKRKNIFIEEMIDAYKLKGIYPVNDNPVAKIKGVQNAVGAAWFPDLQHKFFPEFFDKKRLWLRELRLKITLKNATDLVVSSNDTVNHFKQFYNIPKSLRLHVLQFVSILDTSNTDEIEKVKALYKIPDNYFIVSNGFLKHKNHFTVLKALKVLKQRGHLVHIVFTGRMEVYADSSYLNQLRNFIQENDLTQQVSLLGVIPRKDQICIMKYAKAVLQPSMFEGWNTTIEDAKSLQLPVIASAIAVHKEQLGEKGFYFDPEDENDLAEILIKYSNTNPTPFYGNYEERIKCFARDFIKIFQNGVNQSND